MKIVLATLVLWTGITAFARAEGPFLSGVTAKATSEQVPSYTGAENTVKAEGLVEEPKGSGKFRLTPDARGWNSNYGDPNDESPLLQFDLQKVTTVGKFRVWNDRSGRAFRSVTVQYSNDTVRWKTVPQRFQFAKGPEKGDYYGEEYVFERPVTARYLRFWCDNTWRFGGQPDVAALTRVRFFVGGTPARAVPPSLPYPEDAGLINVRRPPYNAKGDGIADDSDALQKAIRDWEGTRQTIFLPNGTYLLGKPLRFRNPYFYGGNVLRGQSRKGTILRLKDGTLTDPKNPQAVLFNGFNGDEKHVSADWFANYVRDLTVDTGKNNPGAIGIQYYSNNTGALRDVSIRSGDGQGIIGLDLGHADQNGPHLIKNVSVDGFDTGLRTGATVNSTTLENITLTGQRVVGYSNRGQCVSVQNFRSVNRVPAIVSEFGVLTLVNAVLQGQGSAAKEAAIRYGESLFLRNIRTSGYVCAVQKGEDTAGRMTGPNVPEYVSGPVSTLFPSPAKTLNLPIAETPDAVQDAPETWANVRDFRQVTELDDTAAFQKAIDSGATTVYVPCNAGLLLRGDVFVRGKVRRIVGMFADIKLRGNARVKVANGTAPVVVFEDLRLPAIENLSSRTVVVRNAETSVFSTQATGDLYLENVVGDFEFGSHRTWGRQINAEKEGTKIRNTGGTLWILGLKTERGGTLIETTDGGKSELLGGLCYTTTQGGLAPMFVNTESSVSAIIGEVCYSGDPFRVLVKETRDGVSQTLVRGKAPLRIAFMNGSLLSLYTGYKASVPPAPPPRKAEAKK